MELDVFISETLNSIITGIQKSQDFAKGKDAVVNPEKKSTMSIDYVEINSKDRIVTTISFDIAVTASNKNEKGVNGGISVLSIGLGGKANSTDTSESVSRIKFSVGVILPVTAI